MDFLSPLFLRIFCHVHVSVIVRFSQSFCDCHFGEMSTFSASTILKAILMTACTPTIELVVGHVRKVVRVIFVSTSVDLNHFVACSNELLLKQILKQRNMDTYSLRG